MSTKAGQNKKINMSDVASASGVSRQVVSYILNGKATHCSDETKQRVLAVAEKIGYRRNRAALNFTQNRQGNFDLIIDSFYAGNSQMMSGLTKTAKAYNQCITITIPEPDQAAVRCLHENSCDAVILTANTNAALDEKLENISTPLIRINCNVQDRVGCINYNEQQGMDILVKRIAQRQRRALCFIHQDSKHYSGQARKQGIDQSIINNKLDLTVYDLYIDKNHETAELLAQFLEQHPEIDAIIIGERALPPLYEALRRLNRLPGKDISIACINAHIVAKAVFPVCAGIQLDQFNIGKCAVTTASAMLNGEQPRPQYLPYHFVDGDSI